MIENFEATETKSRLLRHHSIIAEEFHNKYRLWIVTAECDDVSDLVSKLNFIILTDRIKHNSMFKFVDNVIIITFFTF